MQTILRKLGGLVMIPVSPVFFEELKINSGSIVDVALLNAYLVIKPTIKFIIRPVNEPIIVPILEPINEPVIEAMMKPQYTLANCHLKAKMPQEDEQWLEFTPVGKEIL